MSMCSFFGEQCEAWGRGERSAGDDVDDDDDAAGEDSSEG